MSELCQRIFLRWVSVIHKHRSDKGAHNLHYLMKTRRTMNEWMNVYVKMSNVYLICVIVVWHANQNQTLHTHIHTAIRNDNRKIGNRIMNGIFGGNRLYDSTSIHSRNTKKHWETRNQRIASAFSIIIKITIDKESKETEFGRHRFHFDGIENWLFFSKWQAK